MLDISKYKGGVDPSTYQIAVFKQPKFLYSFFFPLSFSSFSHDRSYAGRETRTHRDLLVRARAYEVVVVHWLFPTTNELAN